MKSSLLFCVVLSLLAGVCFGAGLQVARPNPVAPPTQSKPAEERPFLLAVEDVFSIAGRGTVVTGRVERGTLKVGDAVELVGARATKRVTVTGIEAFRKLLDVAKPGDNVGLLLKGVERAEVSRGQVVAAPGSVKPHTKFKVSLDLLGSDEGGRRTPFFTGYRPQLYFRTAGFTATLKLPAGRESVAPGDKGVEAEVELSEPVALEEGLRFSVREGGRTVGSGIVIKIVE